MNKLFLHHRYLDLPPRDLSGNGNDGAAHDLARGTWPQTHSAWFDGSRSWVEVPASASTDDLLQFRAQVVFRVDPAAPARRMNLVEGFVSFAVLIGDDRSVQFSIVDRRGDWTVCTSPPGIVATDRWHTLVAAHDGVSEARVALDANVVGRRTDVLGPVRSVGPLGVAVGRWPDTARYQFHGHISEVALYKYDPEPDMNVMFGAECVDPEALVALIKQLEEKLGAEAVVDWAREFQDLFVEVAQQVQTAAQDTDELRADLQSLMLALGTRDGEAFGQAIGAYQARAQAAMADGDRAKLEHRYRHLRERLPVSDEDLLELARALCLDGLLGKEQGVS